MRKRSWGIFVKEKRKAKQMTRRRLAELAKLDPSYVTLIERDGYVPRQDKVVGIAEALVIDPTECLLAAGYATDEVAAVYRTSASLASLSQPLLNQMRGLGRLEPRQQNKIAKSIKSLLEVVNG